MNRRNMGAVLRSINRATVVMSDEQIEYHAERYLDQAKQLRGILGITFERYLDDTQGYDALASLFRVGGGLQVDERSGRIHTVRPGARQAAYVPRPAGIG
ncbi:MAG: hypothetical protein ABFD97_12835 [Syntrophobacter sp.]